MKLMAAFRRGCDESDPKTAAPIAEEVGEAGRLVALVRPQLRIRIGSQIVIEVPQKWTHRRSPEFRALS
jgi:hypothetical protein